MTLSIGIIGGGIAGLASAYRLASQGHQVTLFESSHELGGLGTFFDYNGHQVDRFYHCIMPSDDYLLQLIRDLGLEDQLYWRHTTMGMVNREQHYPFNTALDLLRYQPLAFLQRLRLGVMTLLLRYLGNDEKLDYTPIGAWLARLFGPKLWKTFWQPMFAAKFGDSAGELPALYIKKRMGRESNVGPRGYLKGGLHNFIQTIAQKITAAGGQIRLETGVKRLAQSGAMVSLVTQDGQQFEFDRVISTVPINILTQIAQDIDGVEWLPELTYQGVVNMMVFLDRPVDGYYWTPILQSETGFDGLVESSALIDPAHYNGCHAAYVMKYTHRDSELYRRDADEIADEWLAQLLRVYASRGITAANVVDRFVFKAPFVEPIYPLGYTKRKPQIQLGHSNVYLAASAQVYPYITSWNSSVRIADECLESLSESV
ncbi:FAD-dependent oxidoreductase [filamentous cyanobacterium LEGE 11480]|uniref:FAD-dependent oxidoreductase n=1 Tax=Romeriopsis navalis LEGE 11480 TaxID=2777977 RepID=A0A928VPL2_9CYAN|nr:FAD-dependent oxidoreductase [Romeriopsis navalis]MBE9030280.1 FAD-dependent oxidoreductase [Romeriopsis navalis LEGE 11480]